ncbi:MAG: transposase domain-containing protein [Myxococcales bacterium]|nr:transposase domain-containing protein [Myxococcales bacterium]
MLGRKNWLFLGSDEGAHANTVFVTLLASCQLHGIEPWAYIRDLLCLLPSWPKSRVLELAPAFWQQTLQQEDTQQRLAANVFRGISLVEHAPTT